MKRILLILISLSIVGCSSIPHWKEHREAKRNFRYKRDKDDEWLVYDSISEPFFGDCEDFAMTMQKQIGGDVWRIVHKNQLHAVLEKDGYIFDNLYSTPIARDSYQGYFIEVFHLK